MGNQIQQEASWRQNECNIVGTYDPFPFSESSTFQGVEFATCWAGGGDA